MKIQKMEKEHQDIINLFNRIVDNTGKLQVELQQVMRLYIKAKTKARSADKGKSKNNGSGPPRKHGNAYTCFVAKNYKRVSDKFPSGTPQQQVIASLGRQWKVLPKKEKEKYKEMALKKAKQYRKNLKAYEEKQGNGDGDATIVNDDHDENSEYEEPKHIKKTASKITATKRSTRQSTRRAAAAAQSVAPPGHEEEEEQPDKGGDEERYDEGNDAVEEEPDKEGDKDKDMYFDATEEHPPLDDDDFEEGELEALLANDSEGTMDFSSDDDVDMFDAAEDMLNDNDDDDDDNESLPESSSSSSSSVVAAALTAPITKPNAKSEKGKGKAF